MGSETAIPTQITRDLQQTMSGMHTIQGMGTTHDGAPIAIQMHKSFVLHSIDHGMLDIEGLNGCSVLVGENATVVLLAQTV
jgi:hypothetical protein